MGHKNNPFTSIKDIIEELLTSGALPTNDNDTIIWKVWDEVVGSIIAKKAKPEWIKDGVLRVKVEDPIWHQELTFLQDDIREKINTNLGRRAILKFDFRMGKL